MDDKKNFDRSLTTEEKIELLRIARLTIENVTAGKSPPKFEAKFEIFKEKRGAFVTIHKKNGELRGCIGYVLPIKPLLETIVEMAEAAALRDPRFVPVSADEVESLEIEISVLSPLREVKDINEIQVGKHGIIIERGYNSGLLLPQVATEYGWDRITFLEHTCRKAGLPTDAWKDNNTKIMIFSADVFSEKELLEKE